MDLKIAVAFILLLFLCTGKRCWRVVDSLKPEMQVKLLQMMSREMMSP